MKPTKTPNPNNPSPEMEPSNLRILRLLTTIMTIVMLLGFIVIVSLLSIAIKKNISNDELKHFNKQLKLEKNEALIAVTYSPKYTILFLKNDESMETLRVMSNKTGKVMSNTLLSDLTNSDRENDLP